MLSAPYPNHSCIEAWSDAADRGGLRLAMVAGTGPGAAWRLESLPGCSRLANLREAWRLADRLPGPARFDWVVLREFLTLPFIVGSVPRLRRAKRRLLLVLNQNVERAAASAWHRIGLAMLFRSGFRFMVPETLEPLRRLGIRYRPEQVREIPFGLPRGCPGPTPPRSEGPAIVGVFGRPASWKNQLTLLEALHALRAGSARGFELTVGSTDDRVAAWAKERGVPIAETETRESYFRALASCDVVVHGAVRAACEYRPSASLHDALASGRSVVALAGAATRAQTSVPARTGVTIGSLDELEGAIAAACEITRRAPGRFLEYVRHRGPENLARLLAAALGAAGRAEGPAREADS